MQKKPKLTTEIGWREVISLPTLQIKDMKAKIDTGARTSALHAVDIKPFIQDGKDWVEFWVPLHHHRHGVQCFCEVVDQRHIKNTGGEAQERYVVKTTLVLGQQNWPIEVSLANRRSMGFALIIGRTAIRGKRILVNPGRSFLAGPPAVLTATTPED
ncbi:ATP-dependent zinc protease family protein [Kiloniella laminariae]|uniref:ATP-dependent zinc protease family protein n=1 Tax=Kiloniella laminariae TaxID=454162 RepID=UPI001FE10612|nr:RimK/LysX family protein [Kiloniella laminariae]